MFTIICKVGGKEKLVVRKESAEKKELGNAKIVSLYYLTTIIV